MKNHPLLLLQKAECCYSVFFISLRSLFFFGKEKEKKRKSEVKEGCRAMKD
jgi:hypothetical protein